MRVRPQRSADRRSATQRRPFVVGQGPCETPGEDAAPEREPVDSHLLAERRHRASVAPEDTAHYSCICGFQFQAFVTTSVACPHCGSAQAW
jgi:hypothetical protein